MVNIHSVLFLLCATFLLIPGGKTTDDCDAIPQYQFRLVGAGSTTTSGRVEVYKGCNWGTICAKGVTNRRAAGLVICRSLGFSDVDGLVTNLADSFGTGSPDQPVNIHALDCNNPSGNDTLADVCKLMDIGTCTHEDDLGIRCKEEEVKRMDCSYIENGFYVYHGNVSTTRTGKTCQRWASSTPHSGGYNANIKEDHNYCRPAMGYRPWCYTIDPKVTWEYCDIEPCNNPIKDCWRYDEHYNHFYNGELARTIDGKTCRFWNTIAPAEDILHANVKENHNYCRFASRNRYAWCYINDPNDTFGVCDIQRCPDDKEGVWRLKS